MEKEIQEVNSDVDDLENTVDGIENEHFIVQHALDEVFDAVIILKKQMKLIFPHWCNECEEAIKDEKELKIHRKKHARKKS